MVLCYIDLYPHRESVERWQSWSIASDLKSDEVQASVGSNPTFSDQNLYTWKNYTNHALGVILSIV